MIGSIRGRGKWSFGQCLFSDVKSTHIRMMSVSFLGTITVLASHSLYLISLMNSASSSLLTSTLMASARGSDNRQMDCLTGLSSGNTLSAFSANFPGNSWHVRRTPDEDFQVLTEEFDECAFLCGAEVVGYQRRLGGVRRVDLHLLRVDC